MRLNATRTGKCRRTWISTMFLTVFTYFHLTMTKPLRRVRKKIKSSQSTPRCSSVYVTHRSTKCFNQFPNADQNIKISTPSTISVDRRLRCRSRRLAQSQVRFDAYPVWVSTHRWAGFRISSMIYTNVSRQTVRGGRPDLQPSPERLRRCRGASDERLLTV